ncbi:MAG: hypothetical protein BGO69_00925 [Bacteroidetes bacterium 46-16]|nr:MAG: hypothetical protein BGO69_00925 [Bacteroidetes bacterium 46-16]
MNKQKLFFVLAAMAWLAVSCNKGNKPYYYTFDNNSSHKMNLRIYQTLDDYNMSLNPYISYTVEPGDKVEIPSTQLPETKQYYADWYNDDFTYTNWFNKQHIKAHFSTQFTPGYSNNNVTKMDVLHDYARILCLDGSGVQTTWEAVDGWNFVNGSLGDTIWWPQMNNFQKYNQFQFNKNCIGHFFYKQQNTGVLTDYNFVLRTPDYGTEAGNTTGHLYIYTANDWDSLGVIDYHIWPNADGGYKVSDTMEVSMGDKGHWIMVKSNAK